MTITMIVIKMHIQTHTDQKKLSKKVISSSIREVDYDAFNKSAIGQDALIKVDTLINKTLFKSSHSSKNQNLSLQAIQHHFSSTGHQVRARLCLYACARLGISQQDMLILAAATELLHNASLIHDDIQDNDDMRRGKPAIWKKYGQNIGICAGDLLLSAAYGVLENYSHSKTLSKVIAKLNQKTRLAIEGQSEDVTYKDNHNPSHIISIERYVQIAVQKSGALLSLPLELALIAAEKNEYIDTARKATEAFAVGYQIADDIEDIAKDAGSVTKSRSINITFVLNALGYENEKEQSIAMSYKYLNDAVYHAQKLPAESGLLLVSLANTLKNKIKH